MRPHEGPGQRCCTYIPNISMGAPERGREGLTSRDSIYPRENYGNDDGEETTMMRQYHLIPEKYSATNGYQRACRRTTAPFTYKVLRDHYLTLPSLEWMAGKQGRVYSANRSGAVCKGSRLRSMRPHTTARTLT
jgi:hypothetical protein